MNLGRKNQARLREIPAPVMLLCLSLAAAAGAGCALTDRTAAPALDAFCLEAQQVVVRTDHPFALIDHADFDSFVRSKATLDPPTVQQFIWYEQDDPDRPVMISCKMKSADLLNETFGPGTAGPEGECQDMNRLTLQRYRDAHGGESPPVVFDPAPEPKKPGLPAMTGPDWLKPYGLTARDAEGVLHIRTKGFRVNWGDKRFARMPPRFRGVQYCHFIAPDHLARLLEGSAQPGLVVGREIPPGR